jgi:hypothetical protein
MRRIAIIWVFTCPTGTRRLVYLLKLVEYLFGGKFYSPEAAVPLGGQ